MRHTGAAAAPRPPAAAAAARRSVSTAAAASTPRRSVSAAATASTPPLSSATVSRRAADVCVVGDSLQALAAAYLLAKRGRRTVVIEHAAPELVGLSGARPDVPLHLPAPTAHRVNAATESFALWRGVEAASGARDLLQLCGSVDVAPMRGSSPAVEALGAMQDASREADLQFAMLSPYEATAAFPRLRPPSGTAALYTPLGGAVNAAVAAAVLRAMAERAGADFASGGRCLLGWRDGSSHWALRTAAASGGGDEAQIECEQLLLMPDAAAQAQTMRLFGLAVPGARLWRVPAGRWRAQEECAALPLWSLLGTSSKRSLDDPSAVDSCWGMPVLDWAPGTMLVSQALSDGMRDQAATQESGGGEAAPGGGSGVAAGTAPADLGGLGGLAAGGGSLAAAELGGFGGFAAEAALDLADRPGSVEALDAELARVAAQQAQRERAERRLGGAGALAAGMISGLGERRAGQDGQRTFVATPDGEPGVGSHPGYEDGRLVVCFPGAATAPGCLPGDQLAPLLGRLASGVLTGSPFEAVDGAAVALARDALAAAAAELAADSWAEMGQLLATAE